MLNCAHIVEQKEGQEEGGRFSCRAGNGHGQSSKILGNRRGTGASKKAHARKENHHGNFARDGPGSFFHRFGKLVVRTRLQQPNETFNHVTFQCRCRGNGNQRNRIDVENELSKEQRVAKRRQWIKVSRESRPYSTQLRIPKPLAQEYTNDNNTYFILSDTKFGHDSF